MKNLIPLIVLFIGCSIGFSNAQYSEINAETKVPPHPRLLLLKGEEKNLKRRIMKDPLWTKIHETLLDEAKEIVKLPLNERKKIGRRLLSVSRENLRRIFILSYAYRMTDEKDYLKRAEDEMLKAASFEDWNPSHFLDVGEMSMALGIGYDWLYNKLPDSSKKIIETAIIEKGLQASYVEKDNWFISAVHNWNQVCHGGISYGALAIWEKDPKLASSIVERAIDKIKIPMKHYAPNGAYPEGVGYWDYGTSFNVMFISALEKAFNSDFDLSKLPGFLETGYYVLQMTTPSLNVFAYSDNGGKAFISPTLFWLYDKTKDPSLLYNQARMIKESGVEGLRKNRLAPAMLIWGAQASLNNPVVPDKLFWKAEGDNPVGVMRSGWGHEDIYMGVKLGSPQVNHGHMDVGSFVFESDGVLWITDLGGEQYERLESRGVSLWGKTQEAQRWDVFRYNNFNHSTLSFNKKLQRVEGKAEILNFSDKKDNMYIITDLSEIYKDQIKSVKRAYSIVDNKYGIIEDVITPKNNFTMLTWSMPTSASANIISGNTIMLEKEGKKLYVKIEGIKDARWFIREAKSDFSYDSPNNGFYIVGFNLDIKPSETQKIKVYLSTEENIELKYKSLL